MIFLIFSTIALRFASDPAERIVRSSPLIVITFWSETSKGPYLFCELSTKKNSSPWAIVTTRQAVRTKEQNRFFYWSLELVDAFLVKHGILTGENLVVRPGGVEPLLPEEFEAYPLAESRAQYGEIL